jgi:hypothetical protein
VTSSGVDINFSNSIRTAGHYDLFSGQKLIAAVAFNYDRRESQMRMLDEKQLNLLMEENQIRNFQTVDASSPGLTKKLRQVTEGIYLWKYCIMIALAFLLAEILLLRFWRT